MINDFSDLHFNKICCSCSEQIDNRHSYQTIIKEIESPSFHIRGNAANAETKYTAIKLNNSQNFQPLDSLRFDCSERNIIQCIANVSHTVTYNFAPPIIGYKYSNGYII